MFSNLVKRAGLIGSFLGLVSTVLASKEVASGYEVGNGGRSIVCKGTPPRVLMLDLYEAEILRGQKVDLGIVAKDPFVIAQQRLDLLAKVDPETSRLLSAGLERLRKDISFESEIKLVVIEDSKHSFEPSDPNCHSEQLAVLRKSPLPKEKRVLVNRKLWEKMNSVHQAALLLHEIWYERLAYLGERDSVKARYLNSYILGAEFAKPTEAYWAVIKKMNLPIYRTYKKRK